MKNHFITPYVGNKREEVETIYKNIDFTNVKTIIEPFCGSSAMSFYIANQNPNKFNYILNDTDGMLMQLYDIMQSEIKFNNLKIEYNKCIDDIKQIELHSNKKEYYDNLKINEPVGYLIKNKVYTFRFGLFPLEKHLNSRLKHLDDKIPIIEFLRNENVKLMNIDAIKLIEQYSENIENLLLLDPPYIMTCNNFYSGEGDTKFFNIYEYLINKENNLGNIYIILEYSWIIKKLFDNKKTVLYEKQYNGFRKKKVNHAIICI